MARPLDKIQMKHLHLMSLGVLALGVVWLIVAWIAGVDRIWLLPGIFLIISGVIKIVAVQLMVRVAKLGTDEHKPIKAL